MVTAPQVLTKIYDFLLYLIPQVAAFPRTQRYVLGERLELAGCAVMDLVIEAWYSPAKLPLLRQTNLHLEKLRYSLRLCKDLRLLSLHRYEDLSKQVNDIGVQLGGWIK